MHAGTVRCTGGVIGAHILQGYCSECECGGGIPMGQNTKGGGRWVCLQQHTELSVGWGMDAFFKRSASERKWK